MERTKLDEILASHGKWARGEEGGIRAYLRGADLRGADLRSADLGGADLGGADLGGAYLRSAYLRSAYLGGAYLGGADLGGADLGGADLGGADLRGAKRLIEVPVGDPRGYRCVAIRQEDGTYRIFAGCRGPLTLDEAEQHWGASYVERFGDREIGDRYLHGLQWLRAHLAKDAPTPAAQVQS